ncbi:MAG: cobyrinate a,c-diamide synthase [Thalassotalea sp.]
MKKNKSPFQHKPNNLQGSGVMCSALIIAAPHSGSGKTTVTAAIARYHRDQGRKVTVFKVGPDFIDPMILRQASSELVYQLDLWLVGEQGCQELLYQAALTSDLILIEGVMGLFDGNPSSADLAEYFNIPVLGVIDARAMAQTFAAVTFGLAKHRPNLPFSGVLANRVNSERHAEMLTENLSDEFCFYGRMPKDDEITLPERHLGLVQAQELSDVDQQLSQAASYIANTGLSELPAKVEFFQSLSTNEQNSIKDSLKGTRIIIVKDKAFAFTYAANIDVLTQAGADIIFCSTIDDEHLPEGDALYIPGGYPELYAQELTNNHSFIADVKAFAKSGKPIIAECGGMLYLLDQLTDHHGDVFPMLGLIPGKAILQKKLAAIGSQWVELPIFNSQEATAAGASYGQNNIMRGHSFHYSLADVALTPIAQTTHHPSERSGEFVYQHGNIFASYIHWYFPSNPKLTVQMFKAKT